MPIGLPFHWEAGHRRRRWIGALPVMQLKPAVLSSSKLSLTPSANSASPVPVRVFAAPLDAAARDVFNPVPAFPFVRLRNCNFPRPPST